MSRIIERALSIINDNLKDQTTSFADPISIKPMARGGHVLEDDYPTHYLPHVGRQVMADGGMPIKGFEGRVFSPIPVEEPVSSEGVEAYHGSPHEFEEFDPAKIGTGEGAQVYGHGLYFAGNEGVAKYYRDSLTDPDNVPLHFKDRPIDTVWNDEISDRWQDVVKKIPKDYEEDFQTIMGNLSQIKDLSELKHIRANLDRRQNNILDKVVLPELSKPELGPGHMYEVRLDAHPEEHLLDWDKPLKDQHPNVIAAFNKAVVPVKDDNDQLMHDLYEDKVAKEYLGLFDRSKGSQAYKTFAERLGGQDKASEALSRVGIRGIRYLDAGSRGQDEKSGSHNYVIFDPQHIKVKRRYAEGGEVDGNDSEGITAYAFGNSIPHLDKQYKEDFPVKPQLAQGVEPADEVPKEIRKKIIAYHGTDQNFEKPEEKFSRTAAYHYLADDPETAEKYGKHLYKSEIHPKNMIEFDPENIGPKQMKVINEIADRLGEDPEYLHAAITGATGNFYGSRGSLQDQVMHELKDMGHDAVRFPDVSPGGGWDMSTVVLDPSIIKKFERQEKAYGGAIPGPKLTEENADDFARRLIAWTFATAPLFQRAAGGEVTYPVAMPTEIKEDIKAGNAKMKHLSPQEFLNEADPLHIGKGDRHIIHSFEKHIKSGDHLGPLKLYEEGHQDGRHRANAAKDLGVKKVPVVDYRKADGGSVEDPNENWEDAFHATHADVKNFDLSKAGSGTTVGGSKAERAIFLTDDPENAKTYLGGQYVSRSKNPHTEEMPYGVGRHYTEGANIMPLKINTKDFDEWDYGGNLYDANHMKEMIKEARKSKSPGIKIENIKDQGYMGLGSGKKTTTYVVLDPSRIRSKFAKFDPKKSTKRDLMAAHGGSVIDAALDVLSKLRR